VGDDDELPILDLSNICLRDKLKRIRDYNRDFMNSISISRKTQVKVQPNGYEAIHLRLSLLDNVRLGLMLSPNVVDHRRPVHGAEAGADRADKVTSRALETAPELTCEVAAQVEVVATLGVLVVPADGTSVDGDCNK
jgi:hypothetical protein